MGGEKKGLITTEGGCPRAKKGWCSKASKKRRGVIQKEPKKKTRRHQLDVTQKKG